MNIAASSALHRFRNLINNSHPTVQVAGCYFDPADVLERMDPIAFQMLLEAYIADIAEEEEEA